MNSFIKKIKIYGLTRAVCFILIEIKKKIFDELIKKTYSQHGEDLIIDKLLNYKENGFYIDIGAYDPNRFSNTKRFYLKGWQGINIEPNTKNYRKFISQRSRDINLNVGIGNVNDELKYYYFFPETLSTFSVDESNQYIKEGYKLIEIRQVQVNKLKDVLTQHKISRKIDFMNIDTEGFELNVLKSNDWNKFRPSIICIESAKHTNAVKSNHEITIHKFLIKQKYKVAYRNELNSIYIAN
jgi:FkbM family methyltransferase